MIIDQPKLIEAFKFIRSKTKLTPKIALILGSGLGEFADTLTDPIIIPSAEVPFYPTASVQGHAGELLFGRIKNQNHFSYPLLAFKGRIHFYETGELAPVVFPVHLARRLGAKILLVTNAAGGINRKFQAGDLMLIDDIVNLTLLVLRNRKTRQKRSSEKIRNKESYFPKNIEFIPMTSSYFDTNIKAVIKKSATDLQISLREGTYCWLKGPTYETASEIEMLRRLGVDAVGMSTVPEISEAKQLGMKVGGISLISNMATGVTGQKLSHTEVTETAGRVKLHFTRLMREVILRLRS